MRHPTTKILLSAEIICAVAIGILSLALNVASYASWARPVEELRVVQMAIAVAACLCVVLPILTLTLVSAPPRCQEVSTSWGWRIMLAAIFIFMVLNTVVLSTPSCIRQSSGGWEAASGRFGKYEAMTLDEAVWRYWQNIRWLSGGLFCLAAWSFYMVWELLMRLGHAATGRSNGRPGAVA